MRLQWGNSFIQAGRIVLFGLCSLSVSVIARAADEPKADAALAPVTTPSTPPAPAAQTAQDSAAQPVDENPASGVERMPAAAFWPPPTLRGLHGGSMWLNFHGLQWPYYRRTGIGVSGSGWLDTGYEQLTRGGPNQNNERSWVQQGRLVLRVTPTYTKGNWFVQGQAEFVANKDQTQAQPNTVDTDDMWLRTGSWNSWDIQVGRFEGWEVYHLGMGLDLNTLERLGAYDQTSTQPPDIYGVTYAFYRPSGIGNLAFHLYPTSFLRFEVLGQIGNDSGRNALAIRPVGILDLGWLKFKIAGEYKKLNQVVRGSKPHTEQRGAGASLQFVFAPIVEFGVNGAVGLIDDYDAMGLLNGGGSVTVYSVGGFANVRVAEDFLIGGGYNYTHKEDQHEQMGRFGEFSHSQTFVALQYIVRKQLFIKLVAARADAKSDPTFVGQPGEKVDYANHMYSARVRLLYLF